MININDKVEDIEVMAYQDGEARPVKFSDYEGQWLAVIFYPADFTFVCPTELAETADLYDQFKDEGAEILSVSTDTHFVHKAWHDTSPMVKKIKFPMLADPTGKLSRAFGTYIEAAGVALRGTFLIDPDGIVKHFEMNDLNIGRSGKELLRKLRAAKYVREHDGEVCPAGWEPGTETIAPNLDLVGKI